MQTPIGITCGSNRIVEASAQKKYTDCRVNLKIGQRNSVDNYSWHFGTFYLFDLFYFYPCCKVFYSFQLLLLMFCCRAETLPSHFRVEIVRCR